MKIEFDFSKHQDFQKLQTEVSFAIAEHIAKGDNFAVSFSSDKSGKQLRGYWRLVGLVQPYIEEDYGIIGKEEVSNFLKMQSGFCNETFTKHKGYISVVKSLKNATKDDLTGLIDKLYFICEFYEIKDYELKPQEQRDMENYFNNNKKEV